MAEQTVEYTIWDEKVDSNHPDAAERGVRKDPYDWRDPDLWLIVDGSRVHTRDTSFNIHEAGSSIEPNWDEYDCFLQWPDGRTYNLGRNPAQIFKDCLLQGRVMYGCLIARDEQHHN